MSITPPRKRRDFERLLKELGYKDRLPVFPKESKRYQQVNFTCDSGAMAIYTYIIPYQTKKSYLYLEFFDQYNSPFLEERIKTLAERIRFDEKTVLHEVGWEVKYTRNPSEFTLEERKKIFFEFIKYTKENINDGMMGMLPTPGTILAAKPHGPKINLGFNEDSLSIGRRQRASVARRFGFGDLYDDGFQYGRYDEDCILRPI